MQLANTDISWLLVCVVLVFFLGKWSLRTREQKLHSFADSHLLPDVIGDFHLAAARARRRIYWVSAITFCLVIAMLRPQWGFTWKETMRRGVDIVIAVDTSESMLAEDIRPNRLTRAQREILDLLEHLKGDRLGLVVFSGTAFLELPLTLDYGAFRMFLNALATDLMPIKGTNIESAIIESVKAFNKGALHRPSQEQRKHKERALILLTDGEDFEGDLQHAARLAQENNIRMYIFGIGTQEGAPIPSAEGYKKDKDGKIVITRLNQNALQSLATETGGVYVKSISSDRDTLALYDLGIKKTLIDDTMKSGRGKLWREFFQAPLLLAVLMLIIGPWGRLPDLFSRSNREKTSTSLKKKPARRLTAAVVALTCLLFFPAKQAVAQSAESLGADAKQAFDRGKWEEALEGFAEGEKKKQDDYRFKIGRGASHYRLQQFDRAKALFFGAAGQTDDRASTAQALYNAGNSMVQLGEYEEAIKAYEDSLKLVPDDKEVQDNLAYAKRLLEQQKKQQDDKQERQKKSDNKDKKEQKKQGSQKQQGKDKKKPEKPQDKNQQKQDNKEKDKQQGAKNQKKKQSDSEKEQSEQQDSKRDNDNQQQKEDKGEKKDEKSSSPKDQKEDRPEQKEQASGSAQSQDQAKDHDQRAAQLENIEEKTGARQKYRMRKGMKQLEEQKRKVPQKDW